MFSSPSLPWSLPGLIFLLTFVGITLHFFQERRPFSWSGPYYPRSQSLSNRYSTISFPRWVVFNFFDRNCITSSSSEPLFSRLRSFFFFDGHLIPISDSGVLLALSAYRILNPPPLRSLFFPLLGEFTCHVRKRDLRVDLFTFPSFSSTGRFFLSPARVVFDFSLFSPCQPLFPAFHP